MLRSFFRCFCERSQFTMSKRYLLDDDVVAVVYQLLPPDLMCRGNYYHFNCDPGKMLSFHQLALKAHIPYTHPSLCFTDEDEQGLVVNCIVWLSDLVSAMDIAAWKFYTMFKSGGVDVPRMPMGRQNFSRVKRVILDVAERQYWHKDVLQFYHPPSNPGLKEWTNYNLLRGVTVIKYLPVYPKGLLEKIKWFPGYRKEDIPRYLYQRSQYIWETD